MAFNHHYRGNPNDIHNSQDTPITLALEKGDFITAERLITSESIDGHNLDDGPLKMIPLTFVLSSDSRPWHLQIYKQHLRLAQLLVEKGANPNIRIPLPDWRGATRSPMELLVNMIEDASKNNRKDSVLLHTTIGLNNEELTAKNYKEQLIELLDTFLVCGANPNVTTNNSNATVYHQALSQHCPDVELILKLCNFGGDLNQTNVHGSTALMDLIKGSVGDLALDIWHKILRAQPDQEMSSILAQNCKNETALWHAMFGGSVAVAIELLNRGADGSVLATVYGLTTYSFKSKLAPIFAPLLQDSYAYKMFSNVNSKVFFYCEQRKKTVTLSLMNKVIANSITPIVDNDVGYKCFPDSVLVCLEKMVGHMTRFRTVNILSPAVNTRDVPFLMFGKLKAGLQQMCVRTIMDQMLKKKFKVSQSHIIERLDASRIGRIVKNELRLPAALVPMFNIEAARLQLGFALFRGRGFSECNNGCEGLSDDDDDESVGIDDDDDDYGQTFGTSDDDDEFESYYENWMDEGNDPEIPEVAVNEDEVKAEDDDGWETMSEQSDDPWGPPEDSDDLWVSLAESIPEHSDDRESIPSGLESINTDHDSEFGWD